MTLAELVALVSEIRREDAPALLAALAARLAEPEPAPEPAEQNGHEELLTADELAPVLRVAKRTVFDLARRSDWAPFVVRVGGSLRFRRKPFERWLARQRAEREETR